MLALEYNESIAPDALKQFPLWMVQVIAHNQMILIMPPSYTLCYSYVTLAL